MAHHFAADVRLLEDIHGLKQQRLRQPQARDQFGQGRLPGEALEDRVQVVQRMADLVDRQFLGLAQLPIPVEGLLLEKNRISPPEDAK